MIEVVVARVGGADGDVLVAVMVIFSGSGELSRARDSSRQIRLLDDIKCDST